MWFGSAFVEYAWKVATTGASLYETASQPTSPAGGSCTWTTSGLNASSSRRSAIAPDGNGELFEIEPFIPNAMLRPSARTYSGFSRSSGGPLWSRRVSRSGGSQGASTRTSWPDSISSAARASTWRLTPPGYVHE